MNDDCLTACSATLFAAEAHVGGGAADPSIAAIINTLCFPKHDVSRTTTSDALVRLVLARQTRFVTMVAPLLTYVEVAALRASGKACFILQKLHWRILEA